MDSFTAYVLEQLSSLDAEAKPMFGGYGLYLDGAFFGIIHEGALYLKTDEASREKYGTKPFTPNKRQTLKNYYEVPAAALEDEQELQEWAREAAKK